MKKLKAGDLNDLQNDFPNSTLKNQDIMVSLSLMKHKNHVFTVSLALSFLLFICCCMNSTLSGPDKTTVKELDIEKYAGKWYEIARFPNRFEKNLDCVTATYTIRNDGKINVLNEGYMLSSGGKYKKARGIAKIPDKKEPGKLKVSFFLFFFADYYVLELDNTSYQYALVGSSTDRYLWILSRTPEMADSTLNMLINKAKERGYNTDTFINVTQDGNRCNRK